MSIKWTGLSLINKCCAVFDAKDVQQWGNEVLDLLDLEPPADEAAMVCTRKHLRSVDAATETEFVLFAQVDLAIVVIEEARERWMAAVEACSAMHVSVPDSRRHRMVRMNSDTDDMCVRCGMYGPSSQS